MLRIPCFWKSFCQILKILKIFCHIWTQKKKKKRKGWDIILHILDTVKLVLHSKMLNIVSALSFVLSIDYIENKHSKRPSANSNWSLCGLIIFLEIFKSCVSWLNIPMVSGDCWNGICNFWTSHGLLHLCWSVTLSFNGWQRANYSG